MCTSKAAGSKRENRHKSRALTSGHLIFFRQPCPRPLLGICLYSVMAQSSPLQPRKPPRVFLCLSLSRTSARALANSLVWGSFPLSIAFGTHPSPTQWLGFPVLQLQESASCRKLCPANITVQLRWGKLAETWYVEAMVGFTAAPC